MVCVLSIDVGIKNLALCLLQKTGATFTVMSWKWYNVTDFAQSNPTTRAVSKKTVGVSGGTCVAKLRKGAKVCGKKGNATASGRVLCGTHDPAKKHKPEDTQQWCWSLQSALPEIAKDMGLADIPPSDLMVAIEQQTVQNRKMLLQAHVIYGFFVQFFANKVPVKFIPAYNKLQVYDGPEVQCTLKTPYARRKFMGRKHTECMLSGAEHAEWLDYFRQCKNKQDDIADAFLQGLYVLFGRSKSSASEPGAGVVRRRRRVKF